MVVIWCAFKVCLVCGTVGVLGLRGQSCWSESVGVVLGIYWLKQHFYYGISVYLVM